MAAELTTAVTVHPGTVRTVLSGEHPTARTPSRT
jgi:hypothetical protein